MSASELRQAAETLRVRAASVRRAYGQQERVDEALADWLDQCAQRLDGGHHTGSRHSHRIARLINGGAA